MSDVREKPIIFSGPMVRAILGGRKSQTRRILKYQAWDEHIVRRFPNQTAGVPYAPGDRLWVREAWAPVSPDENWRPIKECNIEYRADDPHANRAGGWDEAPDDAEAIRWRSPIHMPRWASRITLEVTEVRVQRLQAISEADAEAEGVQPRFADGWPSREHIGGFYSIWASIHGLHGPGSWEANPWVAALTFKLANKESSP